MTDIRTARTVRVDDFEVSIAEHADGFDAAVTRVKVSNPIFRAMQTITGGDPDGWSDINDAPIAWDTAEYVAVGKAVEEFLKQDEEEQRLEEDRDTEEVRIDG